MTNGIIQTEAGFSVKDFENRKILFSIGQITFPTYEAAVKACRGKFYPQSYHQYLLRAAKLDKDPDADVWENMIYAEDPRGVYDGETKKYKNISSMDRGAATEEEVAYIDALDATYRSLKAMAGNNR